MSGLNPLKLKLYFDKEGVLIGGEVVGKIKYVSGLIDLIGRLVFEKAKVKDLTTSPPVSPSPLMPPIQMAFLQAIKKL
ncbi:MAG: hypothetical protein ABGX27_00740 [Desulfurobacteriaceae bacterium]